MYYTYDDKYRNVRCVIGLPQRLFPSIYSGMHGRILTTWSLTGSVRSLDSHRHSSARDSNYRWAGMHFIPFSPIPNSSFPFPFQVPGLAYFYFHSHWLYPSPPSISVLLVVSHQQMTGKLDNAWNSTVIKEQNQSNVLKIHMQCQRKQCFVDI